MNDAFNSESVLLQCLSETPSGTEKDDDLWKYHHQRLMSDIIVDIRT